jgi:hypothetical protein
VIELFNKDAATIDPKLSPYPLQVEIPAGLAAPANPDAGTTDALDRARQAIEAGADPEAVRKRLRDAGIDPAGL